MKTVLIDNLTNLVICYTSEKRVIPLIKMIVLDVNPRTLYPVRHDNCYHKMTNEFIKDKLICYSVCKEITDFIVKDNIPSDIILKKKIAMKKTSILESVISCADAKMNNSHAFFNPSFVDIIERNDEALLQEYAFVRKLPIAEIRKELLIRKSMYETSIVKNQALIDMWVDKIFFETDIEILNHYQARIVDSFFRNFLP